MSPSYPGHTAPLLNSRITRGCACIALGCCLALLSGCGLASFGTNVGLANVAISVSPTSAPIQTGGTQQFSATVTGTSNTAVTWSATAGSISSSGLYTAPSAAGTYIVKASSGADPTKSASGTVTVTVPVVVSVSPTSASIQTSSRQQFSATVTGTSNPAVTWSATAGSISSTGLYTAPSSAGTYTVKVASAADSAKSASATVSVSAPVVSISITPASVALATGGSRQFTATVSGTSNTGVTWTTTGGTVSSSGLYTAPASGGSYTVTATSVADSSRSASATVTVTATATIAVSVSPTSASLLTGGAQQFTASVSGNTNTNVNWSATGGTISYMGYYTAPSTAGTYIVTATSAADSTKSASATVTVTATATVAVSVSPTSASLLTGGAQQFTASVSGTTNTSVNWSATGGTVSYMGYYIAPSTVGTYLVTATSAADSTKSASAKVTVSAPSGSRTYTTNFPLTENPISESGNWLNGGTAGTTSGTCNGHPCYLWATVQTTPGKAFGTEQIDSPAGTSYSDGTALLTGSWNRTQSVQATVFTTGGVPSAGSPYWPEVELRLLSTINSSAHTITGYEIDFAVDQSGTNGSAYAAVVRWNGAHGNFTYINPGGGNVYGAQYGVKNGDVISASVDASGNILVYKNGNLLSALSSSDTTFTSGNPGIGFNAETSGAYDSTYGFSSFAATE